MPEEPELKLFKPGVGLCAPRGEAESRGVSVGTGAGNAEHTTALSVALVEAAGRV